MGGAALRSAGEGGRGSAVATERTVSAVRERRLRLRGVNSKIKPQLGTWRAAMRRERETERALLETIGARRAARDHRALAPGQSPLGSRSAAGSKTRERHAASARPSQQGERTAPCPSLLRRPATDDVSGGVSRAVDENSRKLLALHAERIVVFVEALERRLCEVALQDDVGHEARAVSV